MKTIARFKPANLNRCQWWPGGKSPLKERNNGEEKQLREFVQINLLNGPECSWHISDCRELELGECVRGTQKKLKWKKKHVVDIKCTFR